MSTPERAPDGGTRERPGPHADPWSDLRAHTSARIARGRTGVSLPTDELLRFGLAHARARDAVQREMDTAALADGLNALGLRTLVVRSAAPDRTRFLLRPDLGRQLSHADRTLLAERDTAAPQRPDDAVGRGCDLLLVIGDGLSAPAIARNALPMVGALLRLAPADWRIGPAVIATQARVALGDELGALLEARLVAILIGERPGLSAPDSLGIYLTWEPRPGRSDAQRNCISNIRPEGLGYEAAARRLWWLCRAASELQATGVTLKDRSDEPLLGHG